jgi:hypothetical protein
MADLERPENPTAETDEGLSRFLSGTKQEVQRGGAGEAEQRIESLFGELDVPFKSDPSGDLWEIDSDVGLVNVSLNDNDDVLTLWHVVHEIERKPSKKQADYLWALLSINSSTRGACIAILEPDHAGPAVAIIARIAATDIDASELKMALTDVFETLNVFYGDD